MVDEDNSPTVELVVSERPMTDDDRIEARALTGFGFWFGPVLFVAAVIVVLGLTLLGEIDRGLGVILLVGLGIAASLLVYGRLRQYGIIRDDLARGVVTVLKGAQS